MALSLAQQLANVETAIAASEAAIEYGVGSRRVKRENLDVLYKRRDQLQNRIDRSSTGVLRLIQVERPT